MPRINKSFLGLKLVHLGWVPSSSWPAVDNFHIVKYSVVLWYLRAIRFRTNETNAVRGHVAINKDKYSRSHDILIRICRSNRNRIKTTQTKILPDLYPQSFFKSTQQPNLSKLLRMPLMDMVVTPHYVIRVSTHDVKEKKNKRTRF
jgi:hypothetical protein